MNTSEKQKIKVAAIQITSSAAPEENYQECKSAIQKACSHGVDLVLLPESFLLMESFSQQKLTLLDKDKCDEFNLKLSQLAKEHSVYIVAGTMPADSGQAERPYARCSVFDDKGEVICSYDKIHLFDVELDNGESYKESSSTSAGSSLAQFCFKGFNIGLSVCYDLRFPEMYRLYQQAGVDLLLVPSAFTEKTGRDHWELLLRARALENQCFVVAANQCGTHDNGRKTYGHSMAIDPWGNVIERLGHEPELLLVELELDAINNLNRTFPVHKHRVF